MELKLYHCKTVMNVRLSDVSIVPYYHEFNVYAFNRGRALSKALDAIRTKCIFDRRTVHNYDVVECFEIPIF